MICWLYCSGTHRGAVVRPKCRSTADSRHITQATDQCRAYLNLTNHSRCESFAVFSPFVTHTNDNLPSHIRSCETLTTFRGHLKSHFIFSSQLYPLPGDRSQRLWFVLDYGALQIYLLTYLLTHSHGSKTFSGVCQSLCVCVSVTIFLTWMSTT